MPVTEPPPVRKSDRPVTQRPGGAASLIGATVSGRYRIDSILGEGGMGTVYAAEHTLMRKRVAIKVLHPDMSRMPDMVARFEREAMAAGHIDHPNIAAATDFGQLADGSFFLVLELVVGENLRELIARGPLGVSRALHIGRQISGALSRAHALGVVHRDLKPDNVMLVTRGADMDFVKVLDFGIAKVPILEIGAQPPPSTTGEAPMSASPKVLTQVGMIYGTPEYMAPEQALGQAVDARADLYAVGVLLFEMLTAHRPFDHHNMATLLGMQVTAPVPAMAEVAPDVQVPTPIEAVVRRLLAKDPAQRFATADELMQALDEAGRVTLPTDIAMSVGSPGDPTAASTVDGASASLLLPPDSASSARRVAQLVALGVLAVVSVGALSAWLLSRPASSTALPVPTAPTSAPSSVAVAPSPPVSAAPSPAPAPPPEDPLAAVVAAADGSLAKGDTAAAIRAIAPLEEANASRADVHRILERAYAKTHDRAAALREADAWLAADPSATADFGLQADVGEIATHPNLSDTAIPLLGSRMGAPGVDILYDLAYASHQATSVARRARAALAQPDVRGHAGPAASLLLDLRDAATCDAKRALLPRARTDGDRRSLALLQPLGAGRGACMRGDPDLAATIAAVRQRAGMP